MRKLAHAYHEWVHMSVKAGYGLVRGLLYFQEILTTLVLSSSHSKKCGSLPVLLSTAYARSCGFKDTKGDCLRVFGFRAQGQENYEGKERA